MCLASNCIKGTFTEGTKDRDPDFHWVGKHAELTFLTLYMLIFRYLRDF